ncbi:helix-turn-helix transcriptional regulator [Microlunatus speluncae]|uniref:helix-turn-helix transcriptional regulator n=1 Tax=Microlunatus speluncae TaxID=2594267 RepID=UPI0012667F8E|nr:YafY family protein [Microlunatus speluncae]
MRASRLVSVLMLLQARQSMTAQELADELGVSVRTVYRDMESLQFAGVPLYADTGRGGGYRLIEGYRTRLTGLTRDEAQALFLTGLPQAADDLGLGAVLAGAERKLHAALPPELRRQAETVRDRFHLDAPGWYADRDNPAYLADVAAALWQQRRLTVLYRRWKEPALVRRTLEPLGLVLKAGRWYLVARTAEDGPPRTYRVNQVLGVEEIGEAFDRPTDFDLAAYWHDQLAGFQERLFQDIATIRLSPRGLERIRDLWGDAAVASVIDTATEPDPDGWTTARIPIESLGHAETEVLKVGAEVELLTPVELRDRLRATAAALAAVYSRG